MSPVEFMQLAAVGVEVRVAVPSKITAAMFAMLIEGKLHQLAHCSYCRYSTNQLTAMLVCSIATFNSLN